MVQQKSQPDRGQFHKSPKCDTQKLIALSLKNCNPVVGTNIDFNGEGTAKRGGKIITMIS